MSEPHLKAKDLRLALIPSYPGITGESAFARLLPLLPYTLLPGAKRRTYLLSQVTQALDAMASSFMPPTETSLHRRRSQREVATAAEPSLHRRRPRKIA